MKRLFASTGRLLARRRTITLFTSALLGAMLNFGDVPPVEAGPVEDFVTRFYSNVLERSPDSAGKAAWVNLINSNCNAQGFDSIARGFFDSGEFRTVTPLSLNGLVTKLYLTFLGRNPDPGGLAAWAALVRQARLNIALQGFIPSQEFQGLLPNRTNQTAVTTVVTRLYQQVLGRAPEQAGLQAWVDFIVTTGNLETAAQGFLASQEFESHPQTFRDYVTTLYRTFLNRDPEPAGLDAWEAILRDTLLQIINVGFVPSAEFQAQISTLCGTPAANQPPAFPNPIQTTTSTQFQRDNVGRLIGAVTTLEILRSEERR